MTALRILLLVVLGLIMSAAHQFTPEGAVASAGTTTLAAGYLLLTAFLAGAVFKAAGLPKLTGYLAAGIITGPEVLGLVAGDTVDNLHILNGIAVSLIALSAGTEMHFGSMRPLLRGIGWISVVAMLGTTVLLFGVCIAVGDLLPFMSGLSLDQRIAFAGVLAVTLVAGSPAVVVALRDETDADGPFVQTALAVTVVGSLMVILMFAGVSTIAKSTLGASADVGATARTLTWEIFGSLGAGVVVGVLAFGYFKKIGASGALFVVALSFVIAEVGRRMHLDPLIVSLSAGVFLRNFTDIGDDLHGEIDAASLPVYVAFFAVAGAGVHLHALTVVWLPATLLVIARAAGLQVGAMIGGRIAGASDVVRRFTGFGLMPQAGLALALALLFQRAFPQLGAEAAALVFGIVAINELVAPVVLRNALVRSGEAGRRVRGGDDALSPVAAPVAVVAPEPPGPLPTPPGAGG